LLCSQKVQAKAQALEKEGKCEEALVKYVKHRRLLQQPRGEEDTLGTADMYNQLGWANIKQGLYPSAVSFFEENSPFY
jgi:hypothetical protein